MNFTELDALTKKLGLTVLGALQPATGDMAPLGCKTLVLLGPNEPEFWSILTSSPEYLDGQADPIDRWSKRVMSHLAHITGAIDLLPFGGPPYQPFVAWALKSGHVWSSPVDLMVHDKAGLFLSFRGALAFDHVVEVPPAPTQSPCDPCETRPCLTSCPPRALTGAGYDLDKCHAFLRTPDGKDCLNRGCAVRRACPVSQSYGRLVKQSAHHMRAFHKG